MPDFPVRYIRTPATNVLITIFILHEVLTFLLENTNALAFHAKFYAFLTLGPHLMQTFIKILALLMTLC